MTVKSVIEIEVNDSQFKSFQTIFAKYQADLAKTPAAFNQNLKATKESANFIQKMASTMGSMVDKARALATHHTSMAHAGQVIANSWSKAYDKSKGLLGNVRETTVSLLKWAGVTSILGTVFSGGAMFGLDRLAHTAAGYRRNTTGLGVTHGESQAFRNTYGRYVDPDSAVGAASNAKGNIAGPEAGSFHALGIHNFAQMGTMQAALAAFEKIRNEVKGMSDEQLGIFQMSRQTGNLGYDLESLRRVRGMSDEDAAKARSAMSSGTSSMGISPAALKAWEDFKLKLEGAGTKIEAVFIQGLTPLTKPIGELTDEITKVLTEFVKGNGFKWMITEITKHLTTFVTYLGSEKFKKDIKELVDTIGFAASRMVSFGRWIGLLPGEETTPGGVGGIGPPQSLDPNFPNYVPPTGRSEHGANTPWAQKSMWQRFMEALGVGGSYNLAPTTGSKGGGLNNLGGLRDMQGNFKSFASEDDGIRGIAQWFKDAQRRYGQNTLQTEVFGIPGGHGGYVGTENEGPVKKWKDKVNRAEYLAFIKDKMGGMDVNARNDYMNDPELLARRVAATIKIEQGRDVPVGRILQLLNSTGSNLVVQGKTATGPVNIPAYTR